MIEDSSDLASGMDFGRLSANIRQSLNHTFNILDTSDIVLKISRQMQQIEAAENVMKAIDKGNSFLAAQKKAEKVLLNGLASSSQIDKIHRSISNHSLMYDKMVSVSNSLSQMGLFAYEKVRPLASSEKWKNIPLPEINIGDIFAGGYYDQLIRKEKNISEKEIEEAEAAVRENEAVQTIIREAFEKVSAKAASIESSAETSAEEELKPSAEMRKTMEEFVDLIFTPLMRIPYLSKRTKIVIAYLILFSFSNFVSVIPKKAAENLLFSDKQTELRLQRIEAKEDANAAELKKIEQLLEEQKAPAKKTGTKKVKAKKPRTKRKSPKGKK